MRRTNDLFAQAEKYWDLERLYVDLAGVKGKNLSRVEKLHLRGLLSGFSPTEIAEQLNKNVRGLEVGLCNTVYQYVKIIVNRNEEKIENWRNICQWLEEAGYKHQLTKTQSGNSVPVDAKVHIENINIDENNKIEIGINIKLEFPLPSDSSKNPPTK